MSSNYIAVAFKQPNLTLYVCCHPPFPHIWTIFYTAGRGREKKSSTAEKGFNLKIPFLCNIFHSVEQLLRGGGGRTQHNRKQ